VVKLVAAENNTLYTKMPKSDRFAGASVYMLTRQPGGTAKHGSHRETYIIL